MDSRVYSMVKTQVVCSLVSDMKQKSP